jgi:hypothetical protein
MTLLSSANATAVVAATSAPATPSKLSLVPAVGTALAVNNRLTAPQALQLARATAKTVVVGSLTTASALTRVNPVGQFTVTESLAPVRAWRAGRWLALDPALRHLQSAGRLVPAVTVHDVSLSDGGSGPLAVLSSAGWSMQVSWPDPLPTPTVSGSTATYHNVPVTGADVVVTVDELGSVTVVCEATTVVAAQALASIKLLTSTPGLSLTADPVGNLEFSEEPGLEPLFTAQAPRSWDSAPLPSRTPVVTDPGSGEKLAVPSGLPAQSSNSGPGGLARPVAAPVAVAGGTITITPAVGTWTGHQTVYPVYTALVFAPDVTRDASVWAQISSDARTAWMPTGCLDKHSGQCLQVGFCDASAPFMSNCGQIGVSRTLLRFPLRSLPAGTKVASADVYLENVWTAACKAEPLELWAIPPFSRSVGWASRRFWKTRLEQETFHGYGDAKLPGGGTCGPGYSPHDVVFGTASGTKKGVQITGGSAGALGRLIQASLGRGARSISLGLRAPGESTNDHSAYLQWRQFMNRARAMILQFTYFHLPSAPSQVSSNPGETCHASRALPAQVGADGLTLYAKASDLDSDTGLTTTFAVYAYPGGHRQYQKAVKGVGLVQTPYLTNGQITHWQPHGSTRAYLYYYTARTANAAGFGPTSAKCFVLYNPSGPAAPLVTGYPAHVHLGQFLHGVRFTPGGTSGRGCPHATNCPVSYTYQLGDSTPVTVTRASPGTGTWNAARGSWTGTFAVPEIGPLPLTVTAANAAGNTGPASTPIADSVPPAPLADGYFAGGPDPDLLFTGTGRQPSLWLAPGRGSGIVGAPVDIGSLGNSPQGSAADWAGALILHGDFTDDHVQDVMAYWPSSGPDGRAAGTGVIVAGTGDAITLDPSGNNAVAVLPQDLCDPHFDNCASVPSDLVAAGDASQQHTGFADLIGYICSTKRCELNLYTATIRAGYSLTRTLSTWADAAPDGSPDWANYTIATAQLPDTAQPHGDPANTVLLALNRKTGRLYESVNTGCPANCGKGPLIGTPGTWTPVQGVPWGDSPPELLAADTTNRHGPGTGSPEIWTRIPGSTNVTAYRLTGARPSVTLGTGQTSSIAAPANDWTLTGSSTDTITGQVARLHGTHRWDPDQLFVTVLATDGGYVAPAPNTIPARAIHQISISLWFRTNVHGGVLAGLQNQPLNPHGTKVSGYAPLLYIGIDGRLRGLWSSGSSHNPLTSPGRVDTGTWQQLMLTASMSGSKTMQRLYLNGRLVAARVTASIDLSVLAPATNLTFAAGYIGDAWPSQPNPHLARPEFYVGQLADVTLTR